MQEYLAPGARILDVGCGNGKMFSPLMRAGYDVFGLDVSANALRDLAPFNVVRGDARHLPFRHETFDGVVCYDVLQHLLGQERRDAVREMRRIMKPGARLFVQAFGREDMRYGGIPIEPDTFLRQSGIIYHYFSEEELRDLLSDFELITIDSAISHKTFRGEEFKRHKIA
ncbi:MAG TPA: class I SAM-dependent methyltransferase, partial [Methanocellaceae archaeon]